jgi:hypothetical protein
VSQMIRRGPLQILDGHDDPGFKPAALGHLIDGQAFAPLTAMGLKAGSQMDIDWSQVH